MPLWFSNLVSWSAQVALIVLIAGLLLRLFPIRHPHARLALLRGFLLLTLLLPILQPWHRLPSVTTRPDLSGAVIVNSTPPPAAAHWRLPDMPTLADGIGVVLVCGIALRFALLALGLLKLRRLRTASVPITMGEPLAEILSQILAKVGVRAEFRISTNVDSPVTFGLTNPVVLLPERFLATEARLQSVIACHELLHARRRDWPQHLIEEIVRAVFWFHPAIAWLISRIRVAREQLVDLEVVHVTSERKAYLQALLEFAQRRARTAPVPAPPFLNQHQLVERISLISKEVHMSRRKLVGSLGAIAGCLFIVVGLSARSFPLKRAPLQSDSSATNVITPAGPSDGIPGGVSGGVAGGVKGGVAGGKIEWPGRQRSSADTPEMAYSNIFIDTVKRGTMLRQVRGLGKIAGASGSTKTIAQIVVPAFLAADVKPGQNASVASRKGPIWNGHVLQVESSSGSADTRTIDIALDAAPERIETGIEVDGTIDIEKIDDILQVGRPVHGVQNQEVPVFRVDSDGNGATRVHVKFGRASVSSIEVMAGLKEGDRVILSDMSQVGDADHVRLTGQSQDAPN
jgi:beta-lactamase regulating signal transducer with metallopeptidase domain